MRVTAFAWALLFGCAASGGDRRASAPVRSASRVAVTQSPQASPGSSATARKLAVVSEVTGAPRARCQTAMARVLAAPEFPGAPGLDLHRGEIFLRAKADPVVFVRAPRVAAQDARAAALRAQIESSEQPSLAVTEVLHQRVRHLATAREALLPEGYLFAETPGLAAALTDLVRLEDLFREQVLWISRGEQMLRLERRPLVDGSGYFHADGPDAGARARLFLFDRVGTSPEALSEPLHRDVGALADELGFSRLVVRRATASELLADAYYEEDSVPTLLSADGAHVSLECEAIPEGRDAAVLATRERALRARRAHERLQRVIREQVAEGLPFDEPRTEIGQEDGKLREHWGWAYRYGRTQFDYNEDRYRVFDSAGRPRVPQVCIDFVRDTFERASGSWYRPRGEPRERVAGRLDFTALGMDNERSVERFVEFAKAHEEWFEVLELAPEEQVPFAHHQEFFDRIVQDAGRYRPGDIVMIYGLRDDQKMHYHSFIVYDADPVSAVPRLVAANAGRPRIRPVAHEMASAPKRSIRARIRPRLSWLESLFVGQPAAPVTPRATEL